MLSGLEVFNTITLYIILFEETLINDGRQAQIEDVGRFR